MTQAAVIPPKAWADEEREELERCQAFLTAIQELYEVDRGKIAALKRSSGDTLPQARGLAWFEYYLLQHMRGQSRRNDSLCLLVAALMTFDRQTMQGGLKPGRGDFGASLASLRSPEERKSARPGQTPLERRLVGLLDATFDEESGGEMAFRLRQAVKFLLSKPDRSPIDWPVLLRDLRQWHYSDKRVQKRWARSFYDVPNTASIPEEDDASDLAL